MYESFYHLKGKPFSLTPDTRFFFGTGGHTRVLAFLRYGIYRGEGFIVVTGDIGAGKTTLIHTLLAELSEREDVIVAHVPMTQWEAGDLIGMVATAFGISDTGVSKAALLQGLVHFLQDRAQQGNRAVLIVDEVQHLSVESLEELRLLANYQMGHQPLIQGFLVGQPSFRNTLVATESLEPLRQRIIASCHLGPMSFEETWRYVEHRLQIVGWKRDPEFAMEAYKEIFEYTQGLPRRVNTLCDRILLVGYLEEAHTVTQQLVHSVVEELNQEGFVEEAATQQPADGPGEADDGDGGSPTPFGVRPVQGRASIEAQLARIERRIDAVEKAIAASLAESRSDIEGLAKRLGAQQAETKQIRQALDEEVENLLFWLKPGQSKGGST